MVTKLDAEIDKQMREQNLPGVVVAISVPGRGEYIAVKGMANLETRRARALDDPFRIASITKTFTATAILQLVDQGHLKKSDTLSKWFPNFPNADLITVDDLLRMRSGIPDAWDEDLLSYYYKNPLSDMTVRDIIRRAAIMGDRLGPPDQTTKYTNVNYSLLEEIIRKASRNPIDVQITEGILKPLKMKHSLYPVTSDLPGQLHGYSWNIQTKKFDDKTILNPALPGGAGAMISTGADLQTYVRALCTGTLLKPATHKARLESKPVEGIPEFVQYGEGIIRLGKFCGHDGTIFGFSSDLFYLPEKDATIVINVNRLDLDDKSFSSPLFFALTKILFPEYVNW
ncbi:MAG: serine hydrolase domain-containing protein [Nitrospiraceae bacterium]